LAFLTLNKAKLFKILITTLVFEKNANFLPKKSQKSQKIVIITSSPDEIEKIIAQNEAQPIFAKTNVSF
jgi:uncharacterized membrane-anchored protein YitT (DUF2179 family)